MAVLVHMINDTERTNGFWTELEAEYALYFEVSPTYLNYLSDLN